MASLLTVQQPATALKTSAIRATIAPQQVRSTFRAGKIVVGLFTRPVQVALRTQRIRCELRPGAVHVVHLAKQGPAGRDGVSEGLIGIAARALSGHRAMTYDADGLVTYAQPGDIVAGISEHAYSAGDTVMMRHIGVVSETSWHWTAGSLIFVGPDGTLTQSIPASGAMQVLGRALAPTSILISIQPIINLS